MVTQINPNIETKNNYITQEQVRGIQPAPIKVRIPEYYLPDNKPLSIKESLEENPMYSVAVDGFFGPLIHHPIASLFAFFGCSWALDKYTNACSGEYDKSLLKKAVNLGDRIENSSFIKSRPMQSIIGFFNSGTKNIGKLANKSSLIRAIRTTPSKPEWEMVASEMMPQRQRIMHDFITVGKTLKIAEDGYAEIAELGLNNEEQKLLKRLSKTSHLTEEQASSYIQLSRLGKEEGEIANIIKEADGGVKSVKKALLERMGLDEASYKKIIEDTTGKEIENMEAAAKKAGNSIRVGLGKFKLMGIDLGILTKPFERVLSLDNIFNRSYSLSAKNGSSATGRFLSKFIQLTHRGLTFGGGKYGVLLFIAPALVETAINVKKADKNEKVGTGVNNLVNHISWVFTFPMALKMMHHLCGAQYAGKCKNENYEGKNAIEVNKNVVEKRRQIIKDFNEANRKGDFKTLSDYTKAKNVAQGKLNDLKLTTKNPITWVAKQISRLITVDLERFDGYNTGNIITKQFTKMRNLPRNMFGIPVRFAIFGLLSMGLLDTIINKSIKAVFGRSYNAEKEEEQKSAKKEQKKFLKEDLNKRLYEAQALKIQEELQQKSEPKTNGHELTSKARSINSDASPEVMARRQEVDPYSYVPSEVNTINKSSVQNVKRDNYSYVPSQNSTIEKNNDNSSKTRSYIPSQNAANIQKNYDNSGLQSALDRADRAENKALKVLAGNFEGM